MQNVNNKCKIIITFVKNNQCKMLIQVAKLFSFLNSFVNTKIYEKIAFYCTHYQLKNCNEDHKKKKKLQD